MIAVIAYRIMLAAVLNAAAYAIMLVAIATAIIGAIMVFTVIWVDNSLVRRNRYVPPSLLLAAKARRYRRDRRPDKEEN